MKLKRIIVAIVAMVLVVSVFAACSGGDAVVTGVSLNKTSLTLTVGDTDTLVAIVKPDDAINKKVTWSTSDDTVATVSDAGLVTAVKMGTATITAKTEDGNKTATCALTVNEPEDMRKAFIFEAECASLEVEQKNEVDGDQCRAGNEGKTTSANPSGDGYVYNISKATAAEVTFEIYSETAVTTELVVCMGHRGAEYKFSALLGLTLNGSAVAVDDSVIFVMYDSATEKQYYAWKETVVKDIDLVAGVNTLVFTKSSGGLNFDYIKLISDEADLKWNSEKEAGGHEYGDWQTSTNPKVLQAWDIAEEPTVEKAGKVIFYCKHCRHKQEETLPAIKTANSYEETVITAAGENVFGESKWTYHFEKFNTNFSFVSKTYPTGGTVSEKRFEAEQMIIGAPAMIKEESGSNSPSNGAYVGNISGKAGASITLEIESDKKTQALLIMNYGARNDRDGIFNKIFTLNVNSKNVNVADSVILYGASSSFNYFNWTEFEIAIIDLEEGKNTIKVALISTATASNIDYLTLISNAALTKYVEL